MYNAGIKSIAYSVPDKIITNDYLQKQYGLVPKYVDMLFGVQERRYTDGCMSELMIKAGKEAIKKADLKPSDIELIVVSTGSSDYILPKFGCYLQYMLGISKAQIINVNCACAGANYGLGTAWRYIKNGKYKNVLVLMGDILSIFCNCEPALTAGFGDSASAMVVSRLKQGYEGILSDSYGANGEYFEGLYVQSPGSKCPLTKKAFEKKQHLGDYAKLATKDIMPITISWFKQCFDDSIKKAGLTREDVTFFSPHPVTKVQFDAQLKSVDAKEGKYQVVTDKLGHSASGTSFICLLKGYENGKIKAGDVCYMFTVGAGFVWGGILFRWCSKEMFI